MSIDIHANIGDCKMARTTLNQTDAKSFFQIINTAAELGFGNIGGTFGCTKAAMFNDLRKTVKIIQISQHRLIPFLQQ